MPPSKDGVIDYSRGFPVYPVTRNWDFDHRRLVDSRGIKTQQSVSGINPAASNSQTPSVGNLRRLPALGSGPLAAKIVAQAQYDLRTAADSHNYYVDGRVACASFVSAVLEKVGAFASTALPTDTHQGSEYRYVPNFPRLLSARGAVPVFTNPISLTQSNVVMMSSGDIILYFSSRHGRFGHVEIYIGDGQAIGNSSSKQRITLHNVTNLRGSYDHFTAYRYTA